MMHSSTSGTSQPATLGPFSRWHRLRAACQQQVSDNAVATSTQAQPVSTTAVACLYSTSTTQASISAQQPLRAQHRELLPGTAALEQHRVPSAGDDCCQAAAAGTQLSLSRHSARLGNTDLGRSSSSSLGALSSTSLARVSPVDVVASTVSPDLSQHSVRWQQYSSLFAANIQG